MSGESPPSLSSSVSPTVASSQPRNIANTPLSAEQLERLERAKAYAKQITLKLCPPSLHINPITPGLQIPPQAVILGRIYIGSINFEINDQDIKLVCAQFGGVKSVNMSIDPATSRHKGFCFVEFDTPDAASLALETLAGFNLGGRALKVGRPNNYSPQLLDTLPKAPSTRLYIANVSEFILEDHLENILAPFGEISGVALIPDLKTRKHKGYGYIEFADESAAQAAVLALNNLELGGLNIFIRKAILGTPFPEGMKILDSLPESATAIPDSVLNAAQAINSTIPASLKSAIDSINARVSAANATSGGASRLSNTQAFNQSLNGGTSSLASEENISVSSSQRYEIMQKLAQRSMPPPIKKDDEPVSRILLLKNMVEPDEIDDEVKGEIEEECTKFGVVKNVVIHVADSDADGGRVKIFVEFATEEECGRAKLSLHNRWFGGKQVQASFYDETSYKDADYSG
ncbi:hypothetical protein BKA69DRAFT_1123621 [Paraphysoderma sedebokerense]|nr:hypothetical protein BKA69DRAFT_1123621 [Paraphysoderma sedebokerense]